jgi:hypothetical protein
VRPLRFRSHRPILTGLAGTALLGCPTTAPPTDDDAAADDDSVTDDDSVGDDDTVGDDDSDLCWQAEAMLDLSQAPGAGAEYDPPELRAWCEGDLFIVESNGIPPFTFIPMTPNPLAAQEHRWEIPRVPTLAAAPVAIPLLGDIGFARNGLVSYGPNEGPFPDPYGDPIWNGLTDPCLGHTANAYHFHALSERCLADDSLVAEPWTLAEPDGSAESPILGFAGDGFPILGRFECADLACSSVIALESGWVQTGDPTTYAWDNHEYVERKDATVLDACNGHVGPAGDYHYHATSTFPYILGCFAGTPGDGFLADDMPGGDDDDDGPPPCDGPEDCVDACPPGAQGCTCADGPMGSACVPTCAEDADCEDIEGGPPLQCDEGRGICTPQGGP